MSPKVSYSHSELTALIQAFQTFRVCKQSHRSHEWSTNVPGDSVTVSGHIFHLPTGLNLFFPFPLSI